MLKKFAVSRPCSGHTVVVADGALQDAEFGKCPRVGCKNYQLLPVGLSDLPDQKKVKLYCAKCGEIYTPRVSIQHSLLPHHATMFLLG